MATWQEIGIDNFRAARDLYDAGRYRSATSRFYYAAFSVLTHELIQRHAEADFSGGRDTPGHAQLPRLVEIQFVHLSQERRDNLVGYIVSLYRNRIAADYSQQRVDKQAVTITFRGAEKVFRYLEVPYERK